MTRVLGLLVARVLLLVRRRVLDVAARGALAAAGRGPDAAPGRASPALELEAVVAAREPRPAEENRDPPGLLALVRAAAAEGAAGAAEPAQRAGAPGGFGLLLRDDDGALLRAAAGRDAGRVHQIVGVEVDLLVDVAPPLAARALGHGF